MSLIRTIISMFSNKKSKLIFILIMTFSIIEIAIQSYIIISCKSMLPVFAIILNVLALLIYLCVCIFSLFKSGKLEVMNKSLEESKLYNKTLKDMNDNIRTFKHDFSNIMQSLQRIYIK